MNQITILGRLTRDPEVRYTPSQKVVCSFTLAVDRPYRNDDGQREADFIPVTVWGKTAEMCGNNLAKGHRLLVDGRLQIRNFDGKDGTKHWVAEVVARNIEFIERRSEMNRQPQDMPQDVPQDMPQAPAPAPAQPQPQAQAPKASYQRQGSYNGGGQQSAKDSYQRQQPAQQGSYSGGQGRYQPAQQVSYQRPAGPGGAASPFDEEVPF